MKEHSFFKLFLFWTIYLCKTLLVIATLLAEALSADLNQCYNRRRENQIHNKLHHKIQSDHPKDKIAPDVVAVSLSDGPSSQSFKKEDPASQGKNSGIDDWADGRRRKHPKSGVLFLQKFL